MDKIDYFGASINYENIKTFSMSLQYLQKIGKDISIEVEDGLFILRALNDTKSAFATIEFLQSFFSDFHLSTMIKNFACKIPIRPISAVFKNLKSVQEIKLTARRFESDHELIFELKQANKISRHYIFKYIECEIVNAVFDENLCSQFYIKPKSFLQFLDHIYKSNEIMLNLNENSFSIRSYHSSEDNALSFSKKYMSTGLTINIHEFDGYQYCSPNHFEELIFSLKEVVSFLNYCDYLDLVEFKFYFSQSGRPIKLIAKDSNLSTSLILATVDIQISRVSSQQDENSQQHQDEKNDIDTRKGKKRILSRLDDSDEE